MEKAVIIYNPRARSAPKRQRLLDATAGYREHGWQFDLQVTEAAGHATELAREACRAGAGAVVACGGDGTLNEVVNGLAGSDMRLALLRGGTGNVFAKEIGIPRDLDRALAVLVDGEERRFDLGRAGDRYFLLMCGIGIDAEIVRSVPPQPKRLLGTTAYGLWTVVVLPRFRPRRVRIRIDEEAEERQIDLAWLLLGNTRSYGGVLDITQDAIADDGLLDAQLFVGDNLAWAGSTALRVVLKRQHGSPGVFTRRLRQLEILTPGVPVQADGEYLGETPMQITVVPQALSILLPRGRRQPLLSPNGSSPAGSRGPS